MNKVGISLILLLHLYVNQDINHHLVVIVVAVLEMMNSWQVYGVHDIKVRNVNCHIWTISHHGTLTVSCCCGCYDKAKKTVAVVVGVA